MTRKEVIRRLRKHKPKNADDLLRAGVPLAHISSGAFRHAYKVYNLPLVVKFPYVDEPYEPGTQDYTRSLQWSITHSFIEMKSLRRVLRSKSKFRKLRRHMPKIYHHHPPTGVILMEEYRRPDNAAFRRKVSNIREEVARVFNVDPIGGSSSIDPGDVQPGNCGVDKRGNVVILDLGLLERRSEPSGPDELS